jgi:hypothetical protein
MRVLRGDHRSARRVQTLEVRLFLEQPATQVINDSGGKGRLWREPPNATRTQYLTIFFFFFGSACVLVCQFVSESTYACTSHPLSAGPIVPSTVEVESLEPLSAFSVRSGHLVTVRLTAGKGALRAPELTRDAHETTGYKEYAHVEWRLCRSFTLCT